MYQSSVWPGAYDFKNEIKMFATWFKGQVESLLKKIEDTEKLI